MKFQSKTKIDPFAYILMQKYNERKQQTNSIDDSAYCYKLQPSSVMNL